MSGLNDSSDSEKKEEQQDEIFKDSNLLNGIGDDNVSDNDTFKEVNEVKEVDNDSNKKELIICIKKWELKNVKINLMN